MGFVDNYDIDDKWVQFLKDVESVQVDIYRFLGPVQNKSAAKRARKKLNKMHRDCVKIRNLILMQKQDNESQYD